MICSFFTAILMVASSYKNNEHETRVHRMSDVRNNYAKRLSAREISLSDIPKSKRTYELCMQAVEQNWKSIKWVPKKLRDEKLCIEAMEQSWKALKYVPDKICQQPLCQEEIISLLEENGMALQYVSDEVCTAAMCEAAVLQNGKALDFVPESLRTEAVYQLAIKMNAEVICDVPEAMRTDAFDAKTIGQNYKVLEYLTYLQCERPLCKSAMMNAIYDNAKALKHVPNKMFTSRFCFKVIATNAKAAKYLPQVHRNEQFYMLALKKNAMVLEFIPLEMRTPAMYDVALKEDWRVVTHFPKIMLTDELCYNLIRRNGLALGAIPDIASRFQDDVYFDFCVEAVHQNALALQFVPDHLKEKVIEKVGLIALLSNNYLAIQYLPNQPNYSDEINLIIASIDYVVVMSTDNNRELNDIQSVYANAAKREGKTITIKNGSIEQINNLLSKLDAHPKVTLAFIDHGAVDTDEVACLSPQDVAGVCKSHPNIQHIELLSCNIAKARAPTAENEMSSKVKLKYEKMSNDRYGLQSMLGAPLAADTDFQNRCLDFCKKNNLKGVYLLSKDAQDKYRLIVMKVDDDYTKITKCVESAIPMTKIPDLSKLLDNQKKAFSFPVKSGEILPIRKKDQPLSVAELQAIREIKYEKRRFNPQHPKYKNDKKIYPFLSTVHVNEGDLQDSYMKKVVEAIKADPDITWDIAVKGASKALHVDIKEKHFEVSRTHLYSHEYNNTFFASNDESNIDHKKLKQERKEEIEAMRSSDVPTESKAKKISVIVKKS